MRTTSASSRRAAIARPRPVGRQRRARSHVVSSNAGGAEAGGAGAGGAAASAARGSDPAGAHGTDGIRGPGGPEPVAGRADGPDPAGRRQGCRRARADERGDAGPHDRAHRDPVVRIGDRPIGGRRAGSPAVANLVEGPCRDIERVPGIGHAHAHLRGHLVGGPARMRIDQAPLLAAAHERPHPLGDGLVPLAGGSQLVGVRAVLGRARPRVDGEGQARRAAHRAHPPPDEQHRHDDQQDQPEDAQPPARCSLGRATSHPLHPLDQPGDRPLDEAGLGGPVGGVRQLQLSQALSLLARQVDRHIARNADSEAHGATDRDMGSPLDAGHQGAQHRQGRWCR